MMHFIDILMLSVILLLGIVNTARAWEYLSRAHERAINVVYLLLIASIHYSAVASQIAGGPVHSGFYVLFIPLAGMLTFSVRNTLRNGHR